MSAILIDGPSVTKYRNGLYVTIIRNAYDNRPVTTIRNMADSPSSVLNTNQRKWVQGENPYEARTDRQVRFSIKQRFSQALTDLALLQQSERIEVDDLFTAGIEKPDGEGQGAASQNPDVARQLDFRPEFIEAALESAYLQMETVAKREIEHPNELVGEMNDRISELTGEYVKNEMYPYFAVLGAYAAMRSVLGTDKAAAQWVRDNFPEGQERENELTKVRESVN